MLTVLLSTLFSFFFLFVAFTPLEKAFPARAAQKIIRPDWFTDALFFAGQYLLWGGVTLTLMHFFKIAVSAVVPQNIPEQFSNMSWPIQVLAVVLLGDLCVYWWHRMQHRVEFFWRFHAVHHSSEHLDWLAAHRGHPVDGIFTQLAINLPALVAGFPLHSIASLIVLRGLWAIFIHANVSIRLGPLRWLLGSPESHHWHHAKRRESCNFANLCPLMDLIFGTYHCPGYEPEKFGLPYEYPKSYLGQLAAPFKGNRIDEAVVGKAASRELI